MSLSQTEFIDVAKENACDPRATLDAILVSNPTYTVNVTQIAARIGNYRQQGLLPLDSGVQISIGEVLRGTTTTYDALGNIKRQSVRTEVPKKTQHLDAFTQAIEEIASTIVPLTPTDPVEVTLDMEDLLTVYPIGDAHIGMLAWEKESGEDHDLKISEKRLSTAMNMAVDQALPTSEAFIVDVGDWFHADDSSNRTSRGNNPLDVDGRFTKVLNVGLQIAENMVLKALEKHSVVHWRSAIGNHNEHTSQYINIYLRGRFHNFKNVIIHDTPAMFDYYVFGKCLIGITHGHTAKADKLGEIMSVDMSDAWSQTKHRYWLTGHVHHQSVKEYPACVVETFRTLASKDSWHSSMGYRSGQDLKVITYHKDHGEVSRQTLNLSLIP